MARAKDQFVVIVADGKFKHTDVVGPFDDYSEAWKLEVKLQGQGQAAYVIRVSTPRQYARARKALG